MDIVEATPVPKLQLAIASLIQVTEAFSIMVLFPFMAFMVEDFGCKPLGMYTGFLAASFCMAQFFSTPVWGFLSNRYGRKPILFWGTLGVCVGQLVFGFATSYPQAIAGRVLGGILCGNLGVLKTFLTEISDTTNRGSCFSVLSSSWSIGTVFAPLLGGLLSSPAKKYPDHFDEGGLFGVYPYLLPVAVCICVNLVTAFMVFFFLVETKTGTKRSLKPTGGSMEMAKFVSLPTEENENEHGDEQTRVSDDDEDDDDDIELGDGIDIYDSGNKSPKSVVVIADGVDVSIESSTNVVKPDAPHLFSRNSVFFSTMSYGLLALGYVVIDETLPLYFKLSKDSGGFSFGSSQIGVLFSIGGIFMVFFTVICLPYVANIDKPLLFKIGVVLSIPSIMAFPFIPYLAELMNGEGEKLRWALLVIAVTVKNCSASLSFTAVTIQVNESADNDEELSHVNSLGQSIASFSRAVGPACGGILWSFSLANNFVEGNFVLTILIIFCASYANYRIPRSNDNPDDCQEMDVKQIRPKKTRRIKSKKNSVQVL